VGEKQMSKPQPFHLKLGWDREKLAEYMLSRISYTAKPSTVSDDLGTDIFCTLFRVEEMNGDKYRLPLNSFAVQVRSSDRTSDFSKNIKYLLNLEIPFFWGVLDESAKRLTLFSGENLHVFFHHVGEVKELKIKPLERNQMNALYDPMEARKGKYTVMFPKVLHMDINQTEEDLNEVVSGLQKTCQLMHRNISTIEMKEYIFAHHDERIVTILAGCGSAQEYLPNFMKRLAENFHNLIWISKNLNNPDGIKWIHSNIKWIQNNCPENRRDSILKLLLKEFKIYEDTYLRIRNLYPDIVPYYPNDSYEELRKLLITEEKESVS
jgi:hypothetical protein